MMSVRGGRRGDSERRMRSQVDAAFLSPSPCSRGAVEGSWGWCWRGPQGIVGVLRPPAASLLCPRPQHNLLVKQLRSDAQVACG